MSLINKQGEFSMTAVLKPETKTAGGNGGRYGGRIATGTTPPPPPPPVPLSAPPPSGLPPAKFGTSGDDGNPQNKGMKYLCALFIIVAGAAAYTLVALKTAKAASGNHNTTQVEPKEP